MADQIQTLDQLRKLQQVVRDTPESFSQEELDALAVEVRDFNLRRADAGAVPSARPGPTPPGGTRLAEAVPDFPGGAAVDSIVAAVRELGRGTLSGAQDLGAGTQQALAEQQIRQGVPGADAELERINLERRKRKAGEESLARAGTETGDIPGAFKIGEIIGNVSPEVATTLIARKFPSGFLRAVTDTIAAATTGGAQFTEGDESRLSNTLIGLGFGLPGAIASGTTTFAKKTLTRDIMQGINLQETEDVAEIATRMGLRGDASLLGSQATRSPGLQQLESALDFGAASKRDVKLEAQSIRLQESFAEKAEAISGGRFSIEETARGMENAVETHVDGLRQIRRGNWEHSMGAAQFASGGKRIINPRMTERVAVELATELNVPGLRNSADVNGLVAFIEDIRDEIVAGGMTAERFQQMLVSMTGQTGGTQGLFKSLTVAQQRHIEQSLKGAMMNDLEIAYRNGVPGADDLALARMGYAIDSEAIDRLRGGAIERLFGKTFGTDLTEQSLGQKLLTMRPVDAKALVLALDEADPLIADRMRGAILTDLLEAHKKFKGSDFPGDFNLGGFFNDLTGPKGRNATIDVLYPNDPELREGFKILGRVIFGQGAPGAGGISADLLPTVRIRTAGGAGGLQAQQTVGRFLQFMAGIGTGKQLERFLFSPDAIGAIRKLAKVGGVDATIALTGDVMAELTRTFINSQQSERSRKEREVFQQRQDFLKRQEIENLKLSGVPGQPF